MKKYCLLFLLLLLSACSKRIEIPAEDVTRTTESKDITISSHDIFPYSADVDSFVKNSVGLCIDQDNAFGCQCVDLMHLYIDKVLGVPRSAHNIRGNAFPIYRSFPASKTISAGSRVIRLEKIPYKPSNTPLKGDIIFYSHSDGIGHVGIYLEGDAKKFTGLDQNWINTDLLKGSAAEVVEHRYTGSYQVVGWLRPVLVSN